MKKGTRVRTPWGNKGAIVTIHGKLAKVILDKHRVLNEEHQEHEDLKRAAWYYIQELEALHVV